ncbi:MAG TPA: 2-C-methyl-D-erythritol 4-phosphate cytidylyltransferase, partial [Trueperaceae bacterium]|nr:2-C-methyl-D-erythritol 4-phosphate cytidylyltransferase [Trueperaceae bacterium]
ADGTPLPREGLRVIQTPQGFARELLVRAHESAAAAGVEATDDAALVRRLGVGVELVEGSPLLHKLTTPDDLKLGLALLELWRAERAVGS